MKHLIELLDDLDRSKVSLLYLKNNDNDEFKFWLSYWKKIGIHKMSREDISHKYKNVSMAAITMLAFRALMLNPTNPPPLPDRDTYLYSWLFTNRNAVHYYISEIIHHDTKPNNMIVKVNAAYTQQNHYIEKLYNEHFILW